MKKLFLLLTLVMFSMSMMAQTSYTEIKSNQLPRKATEWINKNMPGSTIGRAAKTTEKNTMYAAVVGSGKRKSILVFDKDGNYLQRVKNMDELSKVTGVKQTTPAAKPPSTNPNTDPPVKK